MSDRADAIEIRLSDISRVAHGKGNILIYRHSKPITEAGAASIKRELERVFSNHRIGNLEDGAVILPSTADAALADRLDAIVDELAADTKNKGTAALRAILLLRNEAEVLRESAS